MAYYDESGKITIDENAAHQDMQRIQEALTSLESSRKTLNTLLNQAAEYQGMACTAIVEKAEEMIVQIDQMINRLNETTDFISQTVKHYQQVDQQLKNAVSAAAELLEGLNNG